jgi:hypothetical protein
MPGAVRCGRCGAVPPGKAAAAAGGWTTQRIAQVVLALAVIAVIGAYAVSASGKTAATPTSGVNTTRPAGAAAVTPIPIATPTTFQPTTYQAGETVTVDRDGWTVKVTVSDVAIAASYKGQILEDKPAVAGDVFIAAKVTYQALTDRVSYSSADWDGFCAGMAASKAYAMFGPQPELDTGTLFAGRSAAGYIVFEVPAKGEVRLSYKAVIFDTTPTFEVIIRAS